MSGSEPQELLELAVEAARMAGAMLLERARSGIERDVTSKTTPTDLVSEADVSAERAIRELIAARRPEDGFLGEEGDSKEAGGSGLTWVVDPLDGTVNFLYRIPQWSVSVAVREEGGGSGGASRMLAGAVYDPNRDELFCAAADGPAMLVSTGVGGAADGPAMPISAEVTGGVELHGPGHHAAMSGAAEGVGDAVSSGEDLAHAMVATGLAYDERVREAQGPVLARLVGRVRDIRRVGSAALDLTWTAAGRFDAYFERSVHEWDIAAGVLICERAGLSVLELPERENLPWGILVARAELAERLHAIVAEA